MFGLFGFSYSLLCYAYLYGSQREKTCVRAFANNKGADQPVLRCSLISTFVIYLLESIISKLAYKGNFIILASLSS